MKIMELINKFENETDGTVKDFNQLFQLPLKFDDELEVEIGEIRGPETRREVKIGTETLVYDFALAGIELEKALAYV